jgi:GntR family transcriptional regulator
MQPKVNPIVETLYDQVYKILRMRIMEGVWKPQALLPGEVVLSQELGVSVGTVRKAMDQLARENLVLRERGRGTFVKSDKEWQSAIAIRFFDLKGRQIEPTISCIEANIVEPSSAELRALKIAAIGRQSPRLLNISRMWMMGQTLLNSETVLVEAENSILSGCSSAEAEQLYSDYIEPNRSRVERVIWQIGTPVGCGAMFGDEVNVNESELRTDILLLEQLSLDARGMPLDLRRHEIQIKVCGLQIAS